MKRLVVTVSGLLSAAMVLGLMACGQVNRTGQDGVGVDDSAKEPIDGMNDPSIFADKLERRFGVLPKKGQAKQIPWPSSYWPTYMDSINVRWAGESTLSAAAKYEKAFKLPKLEDIISSAYGIDSLNYAKSCKSDSECDSGQGESCAKRVGKAEGRCIPGWFGLCHAWAPAAILEPEPIKSVTVNGVKFEINDIKALLIYAYNGVETRFLSQRCELDNSADGGLALDPNGRPQDDSCRDTNPGTFHIVVANLLGLKGQSFVEDRTFDSQVWNQPMRGYELTESREVTVQQANELIGTRPTGGTKKALKAKLNKDQTKTFGPFDVVGGTLVGAELIVKKSEDASLSIKLYQDSAANLGMPIPCWSLSDSAKPSCLEKVPQGTNKVQVIVESYKDNTDIAVNLTLGAKVSGQYSFNPNAKKLVLVRMRSDYISESDFGDADNLAATIDNFTSSDNYSYILELDQNGVIIGGEWVEDSKLAHPDFLWLPIKQNAPEVNGITYKNVKDLLNKSIAR